MFDWLWNWSKKRQDSISPASALYPERERLIFEYWDGEQTQKGDPLELHLALMAEKSINLKSDWTMAFSEVASASDMGAAAVADSVKRLVASIRTVFNIKPLKDGGLSYHECLLLLAEFLLMIHSLKKNTNPLPTSLKPMAPASLDESSPTRNSSGSGSTGGESTAGEPVPSPLEQA
jgi:hypothetical protein